MFYLLGYFSLINFMISKLVYFFYIKMFKSLLTILSFFTMALTLHYILISNFCKSSLLKLYVLLGVNLCMMPSLLFILSSF